MYRTVHISNVKLRYGTVHILCPYISTRIAVCPYVVDHVNGLLSRDEPIFAAKRPHRKQRWISSFRWQGYYQVCFLTVFRFVSTGLITDQRTAFKL